MHFKFTLNIVHFYLLILLMWVFIYF